MKNEKKWKKMKKRNNKWKMMRNVNRKYRYLYMVEKPLMRGMFSAIVMKYRMNIWEVMNEKVIFEKDIDKRDDGVWEIWITTFVEIFERWRYV